MNMELKKRIMKCLVWSAALTVYSRDVDIVDSDRRLEAFEMWIWKMEKFGWLN